jgi:hypothetical protein
MHRFRGGRTFEDVNLPVLVSWLIVLAGVIPIFSQDLVPASQSLLAPPTPQRGSAKNSTATCLKPAQLPGLGDYDGPLKRTVGMLAPALERKSAHAPRYKPGLKLCALSFGDKVRLLVKDSTNPENLAGVGLNAGIDQASNRDPAFGQGAKGFAKRYGADLADSVSGNFFKHFAYPVIFSEDPRYYRLGQGSAGKRLLNAAGHLFVAHHEDGTRMFNYSQWLGTASAAALGNLYHPGNEHGLGDTARRVGYSFAFDIGYDILREFWPEITHKFKLPFRGEAVSGGLDVVAKAH